MSKKVEILVISPDQYGNEKETFRFEGFRCPSCNGHPIKQNQIGHDEYETITLFQV